ncbi:uncharacterized protein LOC144097083 isoform X1 [Amblyomma americanum]|uniref:Secreted protein n=1 Tax=Amblyomma americanum TaxID=6943 RepID=A0AAQ4FD31_AMBAM
MRPSTLLSLCVFAVLALLATQARPAGGALILPLVIFKKLPKHDPHQHLKKLLQFVNVDVIKGLVGQLINFEAILRHFSPTPAKTSTAASQPTVVMMMDEPRPPEPTTTTSPPPRRATTPPAMPTLPVFPTLPPIPVTPEMEAIPQISGTDSSATATANPDTADKAQGATADPAKDAAHRDHAAPGEGISPAPPTVTPQAQAGAR